MNVNDIKWSLVLFSVFVVGCGKLPPERDYLLDESAAREIQRRAFVLTADTNGLTKAKLTPEDAIRAAQDKATELGYPMRNVLRVEVGYEPVWSTGEWNVYFTFNDAEQYVGGQGFTIDVDDDTGKVTCFMGDD